MDTSARHGSGPQAFTLPASVKIIEVGPRDGLQNEAKMLPTRDKIALLASLARAGVSEIEVTSFTNPRWIPNLADAEEVARAALDLPVLSFALIPNRRGLERAVATGMKAVTLVMSASEEHNRANLNRPRGASLAELLTLFREASEMGMTARISLSTAFGCPFDGDVPEADVVAIVDAFAGAGVKRMGLCDTIGVADPAQVYRLCTNLRSRFPNLQFELHLHDTYGRALANILAGLLSGITTFDASIGGLGGCPYAPGATGNVSTERTIDMLERMNISTGIDESEIIQIGRTLNNFLK